MHLGNYLGAISNWVALQPHTLLKSRDARDDVALYCVVDLHAVTVQRESCRPWALQTNCRDMAATLLACGIDPERSILFVQSHVPAHSELSWLLGCATRMPWLQRMTQFKAKVKSKKDDGNLGLFSYPVLMAADILLYRTTHVPVGHDQLQHIELAREIARTMNSSSRAPLFEEPQPLLTSVQRVMSLRNGLVKMSKSDPSDMSRLNLTDDTDTIALKIRKAKTTDTLEAPFCMSTTSKNAEMRNLMSIYAALAASPTATEFKDVRQFKEALIAALHAHVLPIRDKILRYQADPEHVEAVLSRGAEQATALAVPLLKEVRAAMGFLPRRPRSPLVF